MNHYASLNRLNHMRIWLVTLAILVLCVFSSWSWAQELQAIPPLTALVVDRTDTLSSTEIAQLDKKLKTFEQVKGSQVAVLLVNTTAPEDMFSYVQRAAETYKLGRKGVGDGVLLVVAKNDRKVWIYVMRALETLITDISAKRIIDEHIKPAFIKQDFVIGLHAATDEIFKLLDNTLPKPGAETGYVITALPTFLDLQQTHFDNIQQLLILSGVQQSAQQQQATPDLQKEPFSYVGYLSQMSQDALPIWRKQALTPEKAIAFEQWSGMLDRFVLDFLDQTRAHDFQKTPAFRNALTEFEGSKNRLMVAYKRYHANIHPNQMP